MRIAFYAPMNAPDGKTPSGDRQMARQIMDVLRKLGHDVRLASRLRAWMREPDDYANRLTESQKERATLTSRFGDWQPEMWFTYHLYYRAPDFLGPDFCNQAAIPYVAAEASYAPRRATGPWAAAHETSANALRTAALLFAMTARDEEGLSCCPELTVPIVRLAPFIDSIPDALEKSAMPISGDQQPTRLVTVAMMRKGDKLDSYRILAEALEMVGDLSWTLTIIGDGRSRPCVEQAFRKLESQRLTRRITWLGQLDAPSVHEQLRVSDVFVWPGRGEAYGLAYLEAEAHGLPIVAMDSAGVSSVVEHRVSGLLSPDGDIAAYADGLRQLILGHTLKEMLGRGAREKILRGHSSQAATRVIQDAFALLRSPSAISGVSVAS